MSKKMMQLAALGKQVRFYFSGVFLFCFFNSVFFLFSMRRSSFHQAYRVCNFSNLQRLKVETLSLKYMHCGKLLC